MFPESGLPSLSVDLVRSLTVVGIAQPAIKGFSQYDARRFLLEHCNARLSFLDQYIWRLYECLNCQVKKGFIFNHAYVYVLLQGVCVPQWGTGLSWSSVACLSETVPAKWFSGNVWFPGRRCRRVPVFGWEWGWNSREEHHSQSSE